MSLHRHNEPCLRMSRFRRKSLVKNLAAEVLEPRCLMTEATGTLTAVDAAPLTGAVVVDASLWDDAGLTLRQLGDLLHVFRTGTQIDVITPMLAREITSLIIIGRDNVADLLTIDVSFGWSLSNGALQLNMESDPLGNEWRTIQPVLVDAAVWDNAGLTLRRVDDLLHVFRNDKEVAVFQTLAASEVGRLNIGGGTDATNVVRVDENEIVRFLSTFSSDSLTRTGYRIFLTPPEPEDPPPDPDAEPIPGNYANQELWLAAYEQWLIDQGIISDPESNSSTESGSETDDPEPRFDDYADEDLWLADYQQWLIAHGFLGPAESSDPDRGDDVVADVGQNGWAPAVSNSALLIGQGIATVGIDDRELAEFDTASSDSAFGELSDSEPEDGEGPETLANGGDLAANGDTNTIDVGEGLELDAALSDDFLKALGETPLES